MDKHKRRLKTVKSLVFEDDPEGNKRQREELGDVNWIKLRDIENQIKFANIEIEELRKQEMDLLKVKLQNEARLQDIKDVEETVENRNVELRRMIREEKAQHREISLQRRAVKKEDNKVFEKFVDAHDEKLILRNAKKQVELSPRASVNQLINSSQNLLQGSASSPFRSSPRRDISNSNYTLQQ